MQSSGLKLTHTLKRFSEEVFENDLECSICSEVYSDPQVLSTCFHIFCRACIEEWAKKSSQCPECRTEFQATQILPTPETQKKITEFSEKILKETLEEAIDFKFFSKEFEDIVSEDKVDIKDCDLPINITSIENGIFGKCCPNLQNLYAKKDILLNDVNACHVRSYESNVSVNGTSEKTASVQKIRAYGDVFCDKIDCPNVTSDHGKVRIADSSVGFVKTVGTVSLHQSTVCKILIKAVQSDSDPTLIKARLRLSGIRKSVIEDRIIVLPPDDFNVDLRNRIFLKIKGEGVFKGEIDFVDCDGTYVIDERILIEK